MKATLKEAQAAKREALRVFGALVGDVAVGVMRLDEESYCLKVSLTTPPAADVSLPKHIEGVPVKVEVVGRIHKRS